MQRQLTILGASRPRYLEQCLESLRNCAGFADWPAVVCLDRTDQSDTCEAIAESMGFPVVHFPVRLGCTMATIEALRLGFADGADYVFHVEDDVLLMPGALEYAAAMAERYAHDPSVLSVSAYQRNPVAAAGGCHRRHWFTPWGWGTWRDRWLEVAAKFTPEPSWDIQMNHQLRGDRCEIAPTMSLAQNIGAEGGTNVPSREWHQQNHAATVTDYGTEYTWPEVSAPLLTDDELAMLGQRAQTIEQAFGNMLASKLERYVIVETGAMREPPNTPRAWSDGCSTWLWDRFTGRYGGQVFSCELDEQRCRDAAQHVSDRVTFLVGDAVRRLRDLPAGFADLLYLDSFDLDWTNPHPSSLHHLQEVASGIHCVKPGGLVLIDDVGLTGGKGMYVMTWLLRIGATCIARGYQSLWRMPG